jgi:hypothetical protein
VTTERRNLTIGGLFLAALLAAFIIPGLKGSAASLTHPDPVGPTVYSKSAIGHAALLRLLDDLAIEFTLSESGSGQHVGPEDVLLLAEPRSDGTTLTEAAAMLTARTAILVLPKRSGKPDPKRPQFLREDSFVNESDVQAVLNLAEPKATVVRNASLAGLTGDPAIAGAPTLAQPQLIQSKALRPLLACPAGILIGERKTSTGRIVIVSDPDLISNHGIVQGDNAALAISLIEWLRKDHKFGELVIDEFCHGFAPKPLQILGILFQFPFVLVTAQLALASLLLGWTAWIRFGAPLPAPEPLAAGKGSLIDSGARLLVRSGRRTDIEEDYYDAILRDGARSLRAPGGLSQAGLVAWLDNQPGTPAPPRPGASPREIWTWRNNLLGESRIHP